MLAIFYLASAFTAAKDAFLAVSEEATATLAAFS
jgi:hypothetical protein